MTSTRRLVLAVGLGLVLIVVTTFTFAAVGIRSMGMVTVDVAERQGSQVSIRVPGSVVRAGLVVAPMLANGFGVQREMVEVTRFLPLARRAGEAFREAPDGVFVEVHDGDEHVRIEKVDGVLTISVDSSGDRVRIACPLHLLDPAIDVVAQLTSSN